MGEKNRRKRKGEFSTVWKTPPVHGGKAETWGRSEQGVSEIKKWSRSAGKFDAFFSCFLHRIYIRAQNEHFYFLFVKSMLQAVELSAMMEKVGVPRWGTALSGADSAGQNKERLSRGKT